MPNSRDKILEDILFTFNETARINASAKSDIKSVPKEDLLYTIPHPDGGRMLCGRAASERIDELAKFAGETKTLSRRVEHKVLRKHVAEVLIERFIVKRHELSIKQFDRAMNDVKQRSEAECVDLTHLLPCHLMTARDPHEITLGPVKFYNRTAFRKLLLEHLRDYDYGKVSQEKAYRRKLVLRSLKYYRSFQWVAEVTVKGCDAATSKQYAKRAVVSALDCLQLVLGSRWTNRMRVGGAAIRDDKRAYLSITSDRGLNISTSSSSIGQINFENGWSERLLTSEYKLLLELCGVALEASVEPDLARPISRRFLDAAQWFGEAARDESPSTSIVKYVMALERMIMTEEKTDITSLLSDRVASLCFNVDEPIDWDEWKTKSAEAYRLRSKLVHGSISPLDEACTRHVRGTAELTEVALLNLLTALGPEVLRLEDGGPKRLARWFESYVALAKEAVIQHRQANDVQ